MAEVSDADKVAFYDDLRAQLGEARRAAGIVMDDEGRFNLTGISVPISDFERNVRSAAASLNPKQAVGVGLKNNQLVILAPAVDLPTPWPLDTST